MIRKIIRFFSGTVKVLAEGAETESLLNYCAKNGIEIIDPQKNEYMLSFKMFAGDYRKLRLPARKFGIKIKAGKKNGFVFFAKKYERKKGFAFGMIFIILFLLVMQNFLWKIEIRGNKTIPENVIMEVAKETGLACGKPSRSFFTQDMEWSMLRKIDKLGTAEINIIGSSAEIIINERLEPAEMVSDDDIPTNIIASKYGVIRKVEVFDGQSLVKPGDAVMKGDLLVSAVYEDSHKKLTLKHARANIIAETDYRIVAEFPLEKTVRTKGKMKAKKYEIEILGLSFASEDKKPGKDEIIEKEEKEIFFFGIKLPIKVTVTRFFGVKQNNITYSFEEGKSGADMLLKEKERTEMADMRIISRKLSEKVKDGKYIIEADYICLMNIAKEQPIESNIPWENTDDMS